MMDIIRYVTIDKLKSLGFFSLAFHIAVKYPDIYKQIMYLPVK